MMAGTSFITFCKATAVAYRDAALTAAVMTRRNWPFLIGSVALTIAFYLASMAISSFGSPGGAFSAGGFVLGILAISCISLYYTWINRCLRHDRIRFQDLLEFEPGMFSNVISVAFIVFIAEFLLSVFLRSAGEGWILPFFHFGIFFIFNAIPEVIHSSREDGLAALGEAARFTRENWIEWFLALAIMCIPFLIIDVRLVLVLLSQTDPLLPGFVPVKQAVAYAPTLSPVLAVACVVIGIIVGNWFMLFRGLLFETLSSHSRRSRIYQAIQK